MFIAEHKETKKMVAIKTEPNHAQFPLIVYEANVTLILHGAENVENLALPQEERLRNLKNQEGFAKIYSYG